MRFSKKGGGIDVDKTEQELLAAYRAGVNYFDTAYIYPGSEAAVGEIFERNHIREQVHIATKLPQYLIGNRAAIDRYFGEELARLRTDYVDYYLMHHLTDLAMWEKLKSVGILEWIEEKKRSGAIRNIGFSYHGNTDNFLKILNDYDWDFCQIQYNYLDEVAQAGRDGLHAAVQGRDRRGARVHVPKARKERLNPYSVKIFPDAPAPQAKPAGPVRLSGSTQREFVTQSSSHVACIFPAGW